MREERVLIANATGLHARPAARLVDCASKYRSDIALVAGEKVVDAKSILSVLGASIPPGTEVDLVVAGDDEDDAARALAECRRTLPYWRHARPSTR